MFGAPPFGRENDVGHHFPFALGRAALIQFLDFRGLAVGIVAARLGELRLLGGELRDDVLNLGIARIGQVRSREHSSAANKHRSRK